ncbi:MAG: 2-phospho-L-lactate guanylyltransferase, partial [Candidatus Hydrothermarchaeales archaeon]
TFAIVPIKELDKAKSRLSSVFKPEQRNSLLLAMLEDVLSALTDVTSIVISPEELSAHLPDDRTIFLLDRGGKGLNDAVKAANKHAIKMGAFATLFVPADMPLITRQEVVKVLELGKKYNVIITHATDGGTGILYRRPPDVIESRFTKNSFQDHQKEARGKGSTMFVHTSLPLSLDIDTVEDIYRFMELGKGTRTYEHLSSCGFR